MGELFFSFILLLSGIVLGCPPEKRTEGSVTYPPQEDSTSLRYKTDTHLIVGNDPSITSIGGYGCELSDINNECTRNSNIEFKLTKLSFDTPSKVETIDSVAFRNNAITSLTLPNSVKTIKKLAFADNALSSLVLPNSVETIGEAAFGDNQLSSLIFPESVNFIGKRAFAINRLKSLTLPASLTTVANIGVEAFTLNNNLTVVTLNKALYNALKTSGNSLASRFGNQVETYQDHKGNKLN